MKQIKKQMANDTCKSKHVNSYINYEWNKYSSQKSEIVGLDKKQIQLYAVSKTHFRFKNANRLKAKGHTLSPFSFSIILERL